MEEGGKGMSFFSPDTAAFLLDVSTDTIRDWLNDPTSGLGAVRLCSEKHLRALSRQEGRRGAAPRRIDAEALARFVLRRRRASSWDLSEIAEPTRAEIDALVKRFSVQSVLYNQIKKEVRKTGKSVGAALSTLNDALVVSPSGEQQGAA